jgi:hypothetical protein
MGESDAKAFARELQEKRAKAACDADPAGCAARAAAAAEQQRVNAVRTGGVARAVGGAVQVGVGAGALATPEPTTVTKVAGWVAIVRGVDNLWTGVRQAFSGRVEEPITEAGARKAFEGAGASPETAETMSRWTGAIADATSTAQAAKELTPIVPRVPPGEAAPPIAAGTAVPTRKIPLGFESEAQFNQAAKELKEALAASGVDDATIGVRGSAVTGGSLRKGTTFGPQSDVDFFVESEKLTKGLRTSRDIPGFVHPDKVMRKNPALAEWAEKWSSALGRPVSPGGFKPGTVPDQPKITIK